MLKAEERPAVKTVIKAEVRPAGKTSTMYIKAINFWRRKTSHWPNWPLVDFSAKESCRVVKLTAYLIYYYY